MPPESEGIAFNVACKPLPAQMVSLFTVTVGCGFTIIAREAASMQPDAEFTVNETKYVPGVEYVFGGGFCKIEVVPSPKSHA